jgi:glyoxylase I family protein
MPSHIAAGPVHNLRLTVTDIQRRRQFYTSVLGFQVAVESPPPGDPSEAEAFRILFGGVVMVRNDLLMGLRPMASEGDRFDPDGVGLSR